MEEELDYVFTFGYGQAHPNCYVVIRGTMDSSRKEMFKRYGAAWSMQYKSKEAANVEKWNMKEIQ